MIKKRNKFQLGLMLVALPFVATAAASAHQWIASATPIAAPEAVTANVSADRIHNITLNSNGTFRILKAKVLQILKSTSFAMARLPKRQSLTRRDLSKSTTLLKVLTLS